MATQDKALLMHKVEGTLRTRMFANLLEEAVDEIQDHLDEFEISHIQDGTMETEDMLDSYINAKKVGGRSEKTLVRYRYVIERFLKEVNVKTKNITTEHIRNYFAKEMTRGVAESTVDGIRQILCGYFGWLEHEKMIRANPISNIEAIKFQKKERISMSDVDMEILKRHCQNIRDRAIFNFLLATGCRISEVTNLNRTDVDLDNGECIVLGKGNKERTVFLDDVAVLTLREYLSSRNDTCEALFVNKRGGRLQPGGVRAMLKALSEKAGVDNVHPHRFRRTMVTRLLNRGMPIQEVAIIVGHERVDTTMQYFSSNNLYGLTKEPGCNRTPVFLRPLAIS